MVIFFVAAKFMVFTVMSDSELLINPGNCSEMRVIVGNSGSNTVI